jgi:pimeloyl-ACP methyl ester carboxylesterase
MTCARRFRRVTYPAPRDRSTIAWVAAHNAVVARAPFDASWTLRTDHAPAQCAAIAKWATPRERPYEYRKAIKQPSLLVNSSNDVIIYTVNSYILQQNLPNAELIIYPDSARGSHHQYPGLFVRDVSAFLSANNVWPA